VAEAKGWQLIVGDVSLLQATGRIGHSVCARGISFDIRNEQECLPVIASANAVISLLPPQYHPVVARMCLQLKKHLLTASYVSDEMKALHAQAWSEQLLFLNECGLDPGIDHMSAVKIIDHIHAIGGNVISFESFTGGLIAPETDPENPWRYKFTWNPRNVVMAGQGKARFLQDGLIKYIPYQQLFQRLTTVTVSGYGTFEGYANRDSLQYLDTYRLPHIRTMLRGTLRYPGFCKAWNVLVQLGCCDDSYVMDNTDAMTHADFINRFLPGGTTLSVQDKLVNQLQLNPAGEEMKRLTWSGLFSDEPIGLSEGTPARLLEHILQKRWALAEDDKDMIVMIHRFVYTKNGQEKTIQSSLVVKGQDDVHTAMAKTVGLPLGMAARLLMEDKIQSRGVVIPTLPEFYIPILDELQSYGISMVEEEC
jgi:saccharopine dehydrogenase-like NADP-dependent oxidoreductase